MARSLQQVANAIARRAGHARADKIVAVGYVGVVSHVSCGYRKHSTGEYVAKAYLRKFGWKNTFYQHAYTVVSVL